MPLDERRLAMLREIGVPFWQPLPSRSEPLTETRSEPLAEPPPEARTKERTEARTEARHPALRSPAATPALSAPSTAPILDQAGEPSGGSPGGADVATLDWPALQEAVASCRACALCDSRTHTVFGVGHRRAHWMVVGEAPGEQEDLKGEPFVGPAGRLLDNMLHAIGVTRAESAPEGEPPLTPERQAYIANTLKCRPPRNRNPEPQEMARCEPFLMRQIALVRPRVILAMGRFAVQALLRTTEPIGRLRGRVHRYQGVPLIVTYHPAYLLRNLPDKAKAWDDLCLAVRTVRAIEAGH
jgi:DNA polymerase